MIKQIQVVLITLVTVANSLAQEAQSNWQKDCALIQTQSESGEPRAMGIMASYLRKGILSSVDIDRANSLALKSDAMGSPFGTLECAYLCSATNKQQAQLLYNKAYPQMLVLANDNDYIAQAKLSAMLNAGDGAEKDPQKAIDWIKKSANQNYAPAQYDLGCAYKAGDGVEKDPQKAIDWIKKSANQNYAPAQYDLGCAYQEGDGVEKDPQKAIDWIKRSANQNYMFAEYHLGYSYMNGECGLEKNLQNAVLWLEKAADQNLPPAQYILGLSYMGGAGIDKNLEKAYKYLSEASKTSNPTIRNATKDPLAKLEAEPEIINIKTKKISDEIIRSVKDADSDKYGGPNTATVIKFVTNQGQNNSYSNMMAGLTAQLGQATGVKYKEIKRGGTLKSLGPKIPVGTTLYPVRIVIEIHDMEQSTDYYFYKDEFGDWKATQK